MPRSTFYFYLKRIKQEDKYTELKEIIRGIFHENKGRYSYQRITMELHNQRYHVNHKTVQKLMKLCNLKYEIRREKYRSYKGEVGKVAPNTPNREFHADKPNQKRATDVTEFALHPTFRQTMDILDKAFEKSPANTDSFCIQTRSGSIK
ncbi:MAG: transposase [Lachnospiraceae bacterium]|nr:transposase [Lachnospiraceae bacterium]